MGRSEQSQAFKTSSGQNATDFANAQTSYADTQKAIEDYNSALGTYAGQVGEFAANNPYEKGGEFDTDSGRIIANTADAGAAGGKAELQSIAQRTGQNMAGANAAGEHIAEDNERSIIGASSTADQQRIENEVGYDTSALGAEQGVVSASGLPVGAEGSLYSTSGNAANSALGNETSVANQPGFWDQVALSAISGGSQVGSAFCPVEGEPILLSSGLSVPVENLTLEDDVAQFGGGSSRPQLDILPRVELAVRVFTAEGGRNVAHRHAFKTADGGYVYAYQSKGSRVLTSDGETTITEVDEIGPKMVYPLALGGNHTYCAGGIWALD